MTLIESVTAILSGHQIRYALIGAAALAVHGVSRSTLDQDLLVHDRRVLEEDLWLPLRDAASVDIRRGDSEDPLTGVVRVTGEDEPVVDVVVGRHRWQQDVVDRAARFGDLALPVVQVPDLILLKLYAGGSQDKWDIEQLLAVDSSDFTRTAVDERVTLLPPRSRDLWVSLRPQS